MVAFQAVTLSPSRRNTITAEFEESSKKRKWEEPLGEEATLKKKLLSKTETTQSSFDIDLHLDTPLPFEWQRCLDIKSGEIHFYNTRTHKRTSKDPRRSPEPPSPSSHMSLDLQLNLPCDSPRKNKADENYHHNSGSDLFMDSSINQKKKKNCCSGGLISPCPSWLAFDHGDDDKQLEEMVATVCIKCHMLVMLCKSSPACPNCKFIHPLDQTPPKLFKPTLSLLC